MTLGGGGGEQYSKEVNFEAVWVFLGFFVLVWSKKERKVCILFIYLFILLYRG